MYVLMFRMTNDYVFQLGVPSQVLFQLTNVNI